MKITDTIPLSEARTLSGAFHARVGRSPEETAYIQYDEPSGEWRRYTWQQTADEVARWQRSMQEDQLQPGDRVAIMMNNCREWVLFDQAAQGLGLVTVPVYTNDRPENIGYVLQDAGVKLFLIGNNDQWLGLQEIRGQMAGLSRILTMTQVESAEQELPVSTLEEWLPRSAGKLHNWDGDPDTLATIVYTSGTTGRPKGVMLSHRNILTNAAGCLEAIAIFPDDLMLSFLPLSHMLERTLSCYLPMLAGSKVAFARSVSKLGEDLVEIRPSILISVPRIFERVYARIIEKLASDPVAVRSLFQKTVDIGWKRFEYHQQRQGWFPGLLLWPLLERLVARKVQEKLGGRLRFAVSGGAALTPEIARLFIGLGVNIQQGYGLTETSPVITANVLEDNMPDSVGLPLERVEVKIGPMDELLTRGPCVMLGYWNNAKATRDAIDSQGWFHTGDQARLENGHVYLTGRLKEIIVLANGEKISPADMEMAIALDELFDQILVIGEGKPYLSAMVVLKREEQANLANQLGLDAESGQFRRDKNLQQILLDRIRKQLRAFPGYAKIRAVGISPEPWEINNGMLTPTLKLRRARIIEAHRALVDSLYEGH